VDGRKLKLITKFESGTALVQLHSVAPSMVRPWPTWGQPA
jgi:hypothetical protein